MSYCSRCGRKTTSQRSRRSTVPVDYVERKLDEAEADVHKLGRGEYDVDVGSTTVEVSFDGRRHKYTVGFDDGTSEVVVWPPDTPLTTKGHTDSRKKQQIASDAAKKVRVFRKAENYGWDVEMLQEVL